MTKAAETAQHLNEGALRRMYDEPATLSATERAHYDSCADCQHTLRQVAAIARDSAAVLVKDDVEADPMRALAAVRARLDEPRQRGIAGWRRGRRRGRVVLPTRRRWVYSGGAIAAAAVLGVSLTATGAAQGALSIFQPKSVTTVSVAPSDLRGLPDLSAYGRMSWTSSPGLHAVTDRDAAASESGLAVPAVSSLPASVPSDPSYFVLDHSTGSFTFSADQARAAATQNGGSLPAMPSGLNGSTITVDLGPGVAAVYGGSRPGSERHRAGSLSQLPSLVVGEARAPTVTSTGASLRQIEDYLLSLPGVSQSLAAEIRAIGDPASTLPIPIPVGQVNGHSVRVGGVDGVAVGDNTGVGSVVVWERQGIIYAVGGMLTENQVLTIAGSLG